MKESTPFNCGCKKDKAEECLKDTCAETIVSADASPGLVAPEEVTTKPTTEADVTEVDTENVPHTKSRSDQYRARGRAVSLSLDWDNVVTLDSAHKIRKVSRRDDMEEEHITRHPGFVQIERSSHTFRTGSVYTGRWNAVGMAGSGNYVFPHKVDYEGALRDGMFHGDGTLTYPMGQKVDGEWVKGKLVSFKFRFADGLEYEDPWKYCKMPDRRFYTCMLEGLRPAGRSLLTNIEPTREIPEGCYDTGDGFYNPATKCVWSAIKPNKILRVPTAAEEKWIMENCRKAWDEPTGYRPDLFEHWVTGRRNDSVFQEVDEMENLERPHSECEPDLDSQESMNLNINMIVPPTYNISPASSYSWWETHNYDLPIKSSSVG